MADTNKITLISAALVAIADPGMAAGGAARWARSMVYCLLAGIQPRGFWTIIQYGALWVLPAKVLKFLGIPNARELRLMVIWLTNFSRYGVVRDIRGEQKGQRYMNENEEARLRNGAYFCIEGDHMTGGNHVEEWLQMQIRYHEAICRIVNYRRPDINDNAEYKWNIMKRIMLSCILATITFVICIFQISTITRKDYGDVVASVLSTTAWMTGSGCIMILAGTRLYEWRERKTLSPLKEEKSRWLNGANRELDVNKEFYKLRWRTSSGGMNDVTKEVLLKEEWQWLLQHEIEPKHNIHLLIVLIIGMYGMIWFAYVSIDLASTTNNYVAIMAIAVNIIGALGRAFAIAQDPVQELEFGVCHKYLQEESVYVKEHNNILKTFFLNLKKNIIKKIHKSTEIV